MPTSQRWTGEQIKDLRDSLLLSQDALARSLECTKQAISNIECNERARAGLNLSRALNDFAKDHEFKREG